MPRPEPGSRQRRGYTIAELAVSLTIFGAILVMTAFILSQTKSAWVVNDSEEAAAVRLRTALAPLQRDFELASKENVAVTTSPASLGGGGKDSDAIWFLSPIDPATEQMVRNPAGEPVWQRNILYYLSVPLNHTSCPGTLGPDGYDEGCPHKVLVRKVISNGGPDGQVLLDDVSAYLDRPSSDSVAPQGGGVRLESSAILTTDLLWLRAKPLAVGGQGAYSIDARAVALDSAQRIARAGVQRYAAGPQTVYSQLSLRPRN